MPVEKGLEWTFDTAANIYDKMRPGYVPEIYEDIYKYISIDQSSNVLEVGIGTGQASLPILQKGCKLTAVEYGVDLTKICRKKFKEYANFSIINSKFEDCSFEPGSVDLIYSATAFHWIPEEVGYPKVFQMLRSGGIFARFANHPYKDKGREELDEAIQKIYAVYFSKSQKKNEYSLEDAEKLAEIPLKYGFENVYHTLYHRTRTFTAKEYIALLSTYSDHIAIEEKTRMQFFAEIENVIDRFGGEITLYDTIDLEIARKP